MNSFFKKSWSVALAAVTLASSAMGSPIFTTSAVSVSIRQYAGETSSDNYSASAAAASSDINVTDIDGDGIIEVPVTRPLTGYENLQPEDQQLLTSWTQYEDFYELAEKFSGYYAVSDGYTMIFPGRWTDKVTVKKDSITGETVFYKFEGDINAEMTELMRIAVVPKTQVEEFTFSGYQVITSAGQLDYLVLLPTNKREQLILTIDEVTNNLYVIES